MNNFDIIFIHVDPLSENWRFSGNVGLASIEAFLTLHNIRCCTIHYSDIKEYYNQSDVFGISVMDHTYFIAQNITRRLKEKTVIWGGWTATALPEYILNKNSNVSYIVLRDGEQRLLDLLNSFKKPELFDQIDGIAYRNESHDSVIRPAQTFVNLDDLPVPTSMAIFANSIVFVELSRGCYGGCYYCQDVQKMRFKSADRVVNEIMHWYNQGYQCFFWGDANTLANGALLKEIVEKIEALKIQIHIYVCCRPNDVLRHHEVLETIFKSQTIKLDEIEVGIEANTQSMLDLLGRTTTPEMNRKAITTLLDLRSRYSPDTMINANMILFAHWDMTLNDFIESVRFIGAYQCSRRSLSLNVQGIAGTPIWHDMKAKGFPMLDYKGLQIMDYPFTDDTINQLFSKLVMIPRQQLLQKNKGSAWDQVKLQDQCYDKLLDFYQASSIEESMLEFLNS